MLCAGFRAGVFMRREAGRFESDVPGNGSQENELRTLGLDRKRRAVKRHPKKYTFLDAFFLLKSYSLYNHFA